MCAYPIKGIRSAEEEWKLCIHIFLRERTIKRIVEETSIPHSRVEHMVMRLRISMEKDMPSHLPNPVEMDETYIGGQRKNKKLHIRRIQGKRGHGTDKLPIIGLFSRISGQAYVEVMRKKLDMMQILSLLESLTTKDAVYTDGYKMYRMMKGKGYAHEYVDHAGGELVRGDVHTNNIEGLWGILKRKLSCIGGMRRDNLHLFVAEIVWKFNHRNESLAKQEEKLYSIILRD
jgi:transposase-like protein